VARRRPARRAGGPARPPGRVGFADEDDGDGRLVGPEAPVDKDSEVSDVLGHHQPGLRHGVVEDGGVVGAGEADVSDREANDKTWRTAAGRGRRRRSPGTSPRMLEIDGSEHSGSGSIVRLTAAYAALTATPVHLVNARARRRPKPGLRRQHCKALEAARDLVGGTLEGAAVGSREFTFRPGDDTPRGKYGFDIGSAGSTTALGLALVPLLARRGDGVEVELRGGVFQDFAPSPFHLQQVITPLLARMGLDVEFRVERPGYVPTGHGVLRVAVAPTGHLQPLRLEQRGEPQRLWGRALASHLAERRVSARMADAARAVLAGEGLEASIHIEEDTTAAQAGAAFAVFAELAGGACFGADGAGAPGRPAERIGQRAAAQLLEDMGSGATVDRHAADQLLIFSALADGRSVYRAPTISDHVESAAWLASLFLGAEVDLGEDGTITVVGSRHHPR
jgi:RNA 3'-terminal phosphate cyclase (ATP)